MKTTWQDDVFEGKRKYSMITNDDGTVSLDDVTAYTQQGDQFGAKELNEITASLYTPISATLSAGGWSSSAPYTQTVDVEGVTEESQPTISAGAPASLTSAGYKALGKAWAMVDRAVSGAGTITFYCYSKLPTVDIPLLIKGV